jgi:hypothetical protein
VAREPLEQLGPGLAGSRQAAHDEHRRAAVQRASDRLEVACEVVDVRLVQRLLAAAAEVDAPGQAVGVDAEPRHLAAPDGRASAHPVATGVRGRRGRRARQSVREVGEVLELEAHVPAGLPLRGAHGVGLARPAAVQTRVLADRGGNVRRLTPDRERHLVLLLVSIRGGAYGGGGPPPVRCFTRRSGRRLTRGRSATDGRPHRTRRSPDS